MVVLTNGLPLVTIASPTLCSDKPQLKFSSGRSFMHGVSSRNANVLRRFKFKSATIRIKCFQQDSSESYETATTNDMPERQNKATDNVLGSLESKTTGTRSSFLAKLIIVLGIALTITLISVGLRQSNQGSLRGIQCLADTSSSSSLPTTTAGFTFKAFGYKIMLPEYAPGWIYFWLLMAAGCGLFISEEALNIWVGTTLARMLSLDGSWQSFVDSFSMNAPYIVSTVLWVYWGVCISDMIPFYLGKLFRQSGASDNVCSKLGVDKDRAMRITRVVQRYGNLVGFVERFSLGVRNPTAFLAGAMDISPEHFFAGACCGGLVTLPLQVVRLLYGVQNYKHATQAKIGNWILNERASTLCPRNCCNCSGNLDYFPIYDGWFDSIVPVSATTVFELIICSTFSRFTRPWWRPWKSLKRAFRWTSI